MPLSFLPPISFLLCSFWPKFFYSSPNISVSYHCLPHLPTCLSFYQCILLTPFMCLSPHYPFPACHSVTLLHLLYSQLLSLSSYLCNSVTLPLFLHLSLCRSVCLSRLRLCSQLTCVTRRCSCARTVGHATRTRSASVLRNLRGCCANTPAVRRAKTAMPPPPCTSPPPPCCSALC